MNSICILAVLGVLGVGVADDARCGRAVDQEQVWWLLEDGESPAAVWVFFADKGITSDQDYQRALARAQAAFHPRAIERRRLRRTWPGLFDWHDLPVYAGYAERVSATGAKLRVTSRWLNAVSVTASLEQVAAISRLPCVRAITPVRRAVRTEVVPIESPREPGTPPRGFHGLAEEQLQQIRITDMHAAGFTGAGVVIGVLDTGFKRTHEAFTHPEHPIDVVAEWDFVDDDSNAGYDPNDPVFDDGHGGIVHQHDHGTTVLGTIAGYMPDVYVGGAYDASFVLAKAEDISDEYPAEEDFFVAGLEFIEMNGADLATSSLGYWAWYDWFDMDGQTAVTSIAVNVATSNGLACCTAVGNRGRDHDLPSLIAPSDAFEVISCGAVDADGELADFSSNGPTADGRVKPEVLARGEMTASIDPNDDYAYLTADGTSMSTPLVASAAALLIQAHPNWTVEQIRTALFFTADYYVEHGTYDPLSHSGYGVIDVFAASQWVFCPGDVNGDDTVDQADLGLLLADWGCDDPANGCAGDLNGDDKTDQADLGILLADWGCGT